MLLAILPTAQPPLANLLISLAFGVGQIAIGGVMIAYTARKGRWRQARFLGLALLGAWIACSGLTELVVSGAELLAQTSGTPSVAGAGQIRGVADQAFLVATIALLAVGGGAPLVSRFLLKRPSEPERP